MADRIFNFGPGPAVLPEEVLREAQEAVWDCDRSGIGILEQSHRGSVVDRVFSEAEADCRKVAGVSEDYLVLFLQGGASTQFFMLPAYFLAENATADYLNTGSWSKKAIKEAKLYGKVHVACSSEDANFSYIPRSEEIQYSERPTYVHYTSNNTIFGTEFETAPTPPDGAWLACDASSNIFSKPIDVSRHGLIYAGAQKNLGPAGTTLVLLRKELLDRSVRELPSMLRYDLLAKQDSRYNTPPVFGVYVIGRVLKWLLARGGVAAMAGQNAAKAKLIYDVLDSSGFYRRPARSDSRSLMNVVFRAPSEELEKKFVTEAEGHGLVGLKGHRSVGGMRASLYNAFPLAGCEALAQFMRDFEARHG